jgi:GNAT superfamily N-acetyltransferase
MSTRRIGFLDKSNNADMLRILESAPITTGDITLCFDRQPDIFLLPEIKYEQFSYLGFFLKDKLAGFILNGYYQALVNGEPETVYHMTDFYIAPEARGRGFSYTISDFLLNEPYRNAKLGYAIIMEGNANALKLIGHRHPKFPNMPWARIINKLEVRNIMIAWPLKRSKLYSVRHAEKSDIPAMVSLLKAEHKNRLFGLIFSEATFENHIQRHPGLTIGSYYLAIDRQGAVCGVCAAWDCTSFKQNRVLKYGPRFKPAKMAYHGLSKVFGFAALPKEGDYFSIESCCCACT